jgi:two-component system chemotaxis response regulator CheB
MVSGQTTAGAETTVRALEAGAVECVAKPSGASIDLENIGVELGQAVLRASHARVHRRVATPSVVTMPKPPSLPGPTEMPSLRVIVIAASTGGPPALTELIPRLPANLAAGVIVVQHMPAGFTAALAQRLDTISALNVCEARGGDLVVAGRALVVPGDFHLVVGDDRRVRLEQSASRHGVRPCADVTLESVARVYGRTARVAVLTGMGKDGAEGAALVEAAGGRVFVQDEATSAVNGMPRVAKERARSAVELPLDRIADALVASLAPGVAR